MNHILERNRLNGVLLKIFYKYSFNNLSKIKELAVSHLYSTVELRSIYHVVGKKKVVEQHTFTKYCKCNSFRVVNHLLQLGKSAFYCIKTYLHNPNKYLRDLPFGQGHRKCVSPFFSTESTHVDPSGHLLEVFIFSVSCHSFFDRRQVHTRSFWRFKVYLQ